MIACCVFQFSQTRVDQNKILPSVFNLCGATVSRSSFSFSLFSCPRIKPWCFAEEKANFCKCVYFCLFHQKSLMFALNLEPSFRVSLWVCWQQFGPVLQNCLLKPETNAQTLPPADATPCRCCLCLGLVFIFLSFFLGNLWVFCSCLGACLPFWTDIVCTLILMTPNTLLVACSQDVPR